MSTVFISTIASLREAPISQSLDDCTPLNPSPCRSAMDSSSSSHYDTFKNSTGSFHCLDWTFKWHLISLRIKSKCLQVSDWPDPCLFSNVILHHSCPGSFYSQYIGLHFCSFSYMQTLSFQSIIAVALSWAWSTIPPWTHDRPLLSIQVSPVLGMFTCTYHSFYTPHSTVR